jgi:glycine/D-amino acid oxidase-like deaminating enzyme
VVTERWTAREGSARYPQISFDGIDSALFEPEAGILTARENCRTVLKHFVAQGGHFLLARVERFHLHSELNKLRLSNASELQADAYVFACGAWLGRMFPEALADVIRPTRQDVLFVGTPPGDGRFSVPEFPCWADRTSDEKFYGIPDLQHRGFKIASDLRGPDFDPDSEDRIIEARSWTQAKEFLRRRFPALDRAPLVESRVCQYENTPDLGLLIDRHPAASNVWLVGGGSGHGYKQGPAVGEYVAGLVNGSAKPVPEFALERFRHATRHPVSSI